MRLCIPCYVYTLYSCVKKLDSNLVILKKANRPVHRKRQPGRSRTVCERIDGIRDGRVIVSGIELIGTAVAKATAVFVCSY